MKKKIENMEELLHCSINVINSNGSTVSNQFIVNVDNKKREFTVYSEKNPEYWREFKLKFDYLDIPDTSDYTMKVVKHSEKVTDKKLENYKYWQKNICRALNIDEAIIKDEETMSKAIENNPYFFEWGSEELKNDKDFMLRAIKQNLRVGEYIDDKLKNDKVFMLEAIKIDEDAIRYASYELKNDKDIVLESLKNGGSLIYAGDEIRNNKEVVKIAVMNCGSELKYASTELKNDREIVLEAVKQDKSSLLFASEELKNEIKDNWHIKKDKQELER
ncbi:DUF4116 domain-containing protein [Streptobacillus moniliformis]|uniref:DUF4116 domain-containing protein n=1 Tax=Streptobacillus moniliformis TaxID=34105 RepID=UPI0007E49846|nr:DUF4116 domain-containing protein [Streptobacillus moniliformis]